MVNEKNIALIDDYLNGNLSKEDKVRLEHRFETEPELSELLSLVKFTKESIKVNGQKNKIKEIHQEFLKEKSIDSGKSSKDKVRTLHWWIGIAASFLLLILVGVNHISNFPDKLLSEKYYSYELPTMRSNENGQETLEITFKNQDWNKVIAAVEIQSDDRQSLFLAGISAMELKEYEKALLYFERIEIINYGSGDALFSDETDYYKTISFISLSDYHNALEKMKAINSDENHKYFKVFSQTDMVKLRILEML